MLNTIKGHITNLIRIALNFIIDQIYAWRVPLLICAVGGFFWLLLVISGVPNKHERCHAACGTDPVLQDGCFEDRVICVGLQQLYVKSIK